MVLKLSCAIHSCRGRHSGRYFFREEDLVAAAGGGRGYSCAQHEPPALTLRAGTSRQHPANPQTAVTQDSPVRSVFVNGNNHYLGVKQLMAVSYSNVTELGLLSQQYPPALLPKPGRENVRLQKLLKKTEKKNKKKAAPETAKTPVPFRSNLSPVNEASPDLEHSDHSTPPKTPEAPFYTQHPRFVVRPVYRHVTSPYPHHREYNKGIARTVTRSGASLPCCGTHDAYANFLCA
ncbi:hypothetical protein UPYG_G00262680 [Umbra pygmaea]|uniref:Uncharacterized protein n=1 Tax=Umbra pygmaea TaxID=75934 RepID=A0ABD0WWS0_UMBPY